MDADTRGPVFRRHSKLDGVVEQLCGELLLIQPPASQPPMLTGLTGASVGAELFDLLLNPDHVVRVTEKLTLTNAVTLARQFRIDISLDRLRQNQEERAAQLSAFMGERISSTNPATDSSRRHLWVPLLTVPRPSVTSIEVTDGKGSVLPRPRQREVRRTLEAALYHLFRNAVNEHPQSREPHTPLTNLAHHDHPARWMLQAALLELCEEGRNSPRSFARAQKLRKRLWTSCDDGAPFLPKLLGQETNPHRLNALHAVVEIIADNGPLLELIDLVHSGYLVVAGLESTTRHHHLSCSLPNVEALDTSAVKNIWLHNRRALDPREHNFTVRVRIPLPLNVRQYRAHLKASSEEEAAPLSVSLIAAIRFDTHPVEPYLGTIGTCAKMLDATAAHPSTAPRVRYLASQGLAALEPLEDLVVSQERAARELHARQGSTATIPILDHGIGRLTRTAEESRKEIAGARTQLRGVMTSSSNAMDSNSVQQASTTLQRTKAALKHPLMEFQLVNQEVPGSDVGRIKVNQRSLVSQPYRRPRLVDVWVTVTDEGHPYARTALFPPLAVAALIYLLGSFLFGSPTWPFLPGLDIDAVTEDLTDRHPGAVVSLLLLIPAFALARLRYPDRRNVASLLRRPARLLVATAVLALCVSAIVLATRLGSPVSPASSDIWWVTGTSAATLLVFTSWLSWSLLAWLLRRRCIWRPKGLSELFWPDTPHRRHLPRLNRWLQARRVLPYDYKAPDAEFDLTRPTRSSRPSNSDEE